MGCGMQFQAVQKPTWNMIWKSVPWDLTRFGPTAATILCNGTCECRSAWIDNPCIMPAASAKVSLDLLTRSGSVLMNMPTTRLSSLVCLCASKHAPEKEKQGGNERDDNTSLSEEGQRQRPLGR